MIPTAYCKIGLGLPALSLAFPPRLQTKTWLVMKMTAFLLIVACLQVSANGFSQKINLSIREAPLEKVFKEIQKQSGYSFWYKTRPLPCRHPLSKAKLPRLPVNRWEGSPLP